MKPTNLKWSRVPLEQLSKAIEYGHTASAVHRAFGPKFLRITDIQNGKVDWEAVPSCEATPADLVKYGVQPGDIVFARTGATTGKSFLIRDCPADTVFASYLIRVRPAQIVEPRYLAHFFNTSDYWQQIQREAQGAGQPGVNASKLKSLSVPFPPLVEQRRIADILDRADTIRRKRGDTLELVSELSRSQFDRWFSPWFQESEKGCCVPVSHFVERFEGGLNIATPDSPTPETKYFILKVSAVTWGDYSPDESKPVPTDYVPRPEHFVRVGDLLFSRANTTELVGATVYVFETPPDRVLPDKLWRFVWRNAKEVEPLFVWALFNHPRVRYEIGRRATGTSGSMKNISMDKVLSIRVPWLPIEEQRRFARFTTGHRELRKKMCTSASQADELYQSLVQRAFRGEL